MIGSKSGEHGAAPRPRGRPRRVERAAALEAAMELFWREGYEGASVERLTEATGLNRSSLYADWGDKRGLFLEAVERYAQTRLGPLAEALEGGGALHADLAAFYSAVVDLALGPSGRTGCLISCALANAAGADESLRNELCRRFAALEARLTRRLERSEPGEQAAGLAPDALAAVLAATARGMMLKARAGASRDALLATGLAAAALAAPEGEARQTDGAPRMTPI